MSFDGSDTVHSEGASAGSRVREEIPDPGLHGHSQRVHGPGGHGPRAPRVFQPDAHPLDDRALENIQVGRDPWRGTTPAGRIEDDCVRGRRGVLAKRLGQRPDELAQCRLRLGRQPRVRAGDQEQRSRLGCVQAAEVGTSAAEQLPATASTGLCIDGKARRRERLEIAARSLHRDLELRCQLGRSHTAASLHEEERRHQPISAHVRSVRINVVAGWPLWSGYWRQIQNRAKEASCAARRPSRRPRRATPP